MAIYFDNSNITTGSRGPEGPNKVSTTTTTNISGIFKGNGSTVQAAQSGVDYASPPQIPLSRPPHLRGAIIL